MKTKKQRDAQQAALFDGPRYGWKSVQEVKRGDKIVIAELETLVQSVREHEGNWYVRTLRHMMLGLPRS